MGLGWETLHAINPRLIVVRVSGFGQTGPYKDKPGFGTLAEAMSGFAHITGQPDGPPTLPGYGLADSMAGQFGTWAVMFALYERDHKSGKGQMLDLSVLEPLFTTTGDQALAYDQLGVIQHRTGNRVPSIGAPRNTYQPRTVIGLPFRPMRRLWPNGVFVAIGRPELMMTRVLPTTAPVIENIDEVDAIVGGWIGAHTAEEALKRFDEFECACAPVYDITGILSDPHFQARETVTTVADPELGPVKMQNVVPKFSRTPGAITLAGAHPYGTSQRRIYGQQLGLSPQKLTELQEKGVI